MEQVLTPQRKALAVRGIQMLVIGVMITLVLPLQGFLHCCSFSGCCLQVRETVPSLIQELKSKSGTTLLSLSCLVTVSRSRSPGRTSRCKTQILYLRVLVIAFLTRALQTKLCSFSFKRSTLSSWRSSSCVKLYGSYSNFARSALSFQIDIMVSRS